MELLIGTMSSLVQLARIVYLTKAHSLDLHHALKSNALIEIFTS
jgi:hypothetical protein